MTYRPIGTRRIAGAWHHDGRGEWAPLRGPFAAMISDVLDLWPDAVVSVEIQPKHEECEHG